MSQSDYIFIQIPILPPGANRTYMRTHSGIALTKAARQWDIDAALLVGSAAADYDFSPDIDAEYQIVICWWGGRHDSDAHLKLVQDCVTRKLGFDDRQIKTCIIQRIPATDDSQGMHVYLFANVDDWLGKKLYEWQAVFKEVE